MRVHNLLAIAAICLIASNASASLLTDGSFENPPGADNVGSAAWTDGGSTSFWSLNRSLSPGGVGPQDGAFTSVTNPGGRTVIEQTISTAVADGDTFDFSGFFGTATTNNSDVAILLSFDDPGTASDINLTDGFGVALSPVNGANRAPFSSNTDWTELPFSGTYDGAGATEVTISIVISTGGGQTYADNFTLTQAPAVPEPTAVALGLLGLAGVAIRRRR